MPCLKSGPFSLLNQQVLLLLSSPKRLPSDCSPRNRDHGHQPKKSQESPKPQGRGSCSSPGLGPAQCRGAKRRRHSSCVALDSAAGNYAIPSPSRLRNSVPTLQSQDIWQTCDCCDSSFTLLGLFCTTWKLTYLVFTLLDDGPRQLTHVSTLQLPEEDPGNDTASTIGSLASTSASLSSSIFEYRTIHGRTYHGQMGTAESWTPNDQRHVEAMEIL